jgi:WD40 repeat protein
MLKLLVIILFATTFTQIKVHADWPECPIANGEQGRHLRGDRVVLYADRVPLRKEPDEKSAQIATLYEGDLFTITSEATCPGGENGMRYYEVWGNSTLTGWIRDNGIFPYFPTAPAYLVRELTFTPDDKYLLVSVGDRNVWAWDVRSNKKAYKVFTGGSIFGITARTDIAFTGDGKFFLAIDSGEDTFSLYDAKTSKRVRSFIGHETGINSIALSPDERYALSGDGRADKPESSARLWDVQSGEQLHVFRDDHSVAVLKVLFLPDNQYFFIDFGSFVAQYELTSFKEVRRYEKRSLIAVTPDGKQVLMTGKDTMILYNTATGDVIHTYPIKWMSEVVFTKDGKYFASADRDGLTLWDVKTTQQIRKFKEPTQGELKSSGPLLISPDGKYLYSGSTSGGTVMVWNIATGSLVRTFSMYQER